MILTLDTSKGKPSLKEVGAGKQRTANVINVRGFAAAQTDRLLASWQWDGGYTPWEIANSLAVMRSRSRELEKNSSHYKRYLDLNVTNIVGEGFNFQSRPMDGIPGKWRLDSEAAAFIEYHFARWCTWRDPLSRRTYCDATGSQTITQMDRLSVRTWKRDGESFLWIDTAAQNPYGLAIKAMRPDLCEHLYNVDKLPGGNYIRCGVEFDKYGTVQAYYVRTSQEHAYVTTSYGPLIRIPSNRILHLYTKRAENQPRGIPEGHASMVKLKMIEEFDKAELTAARDEACSVRSYYAPRGQEDEIADLTNPDDPNAVSASQALSMEKEPGQSEVLPVGWKQEVHVPQHPNREAGLFKDGMLKDIAGGFGVEYANFANNWAAVSWSSVRGGTISERDHYRVEQDEYITQVKTPIFMLWLKSFLSLASSGNLPASKFEKFARHSFNGRRWQWVDPRADVQANKMARDNGWMTDSQIASDMGTDYDENVEEVKRVEVLTEGTPLVNRWATTVQGKEEVTPEGETAPGKKKTEESK